MGIVRLIPGACLFFPLRIACGRSELNPCIPGSYCRIRQGNRNRNVNEGTEEGIHGKIPIGSEMAVIGVNKKVHCNLCLLPSVPFSFFS